MRWSRSGRLSRARWSCSRGLLAALSAPGRAVARRGRVGAGLRRRPDGAVARGVGPAGADAARARPTWSRWPGPRSPAPSRRWSPTRALRRARWPCRWSRWPPWRWRSTRSTAGWRRRTGTRVRLRRPLRRGGRRVPDARAQRARRAVVRRLGAGDRRGPLRVRAAGWVLPWLRRRLPSRYWRKVVTAVQGSSWSSRPPTCCPAAPTYVALAVALALLAESFGRDVLWLVRHRRDRAWSTCRPGVDGRAAAA